MKIFCICVISFLCTFNLSADAPKKKTVCLNMIVKDESKVIKRCLGSLKDLIDYWVIFDTGSTDGTQKIIKKYLKDIPGELHQSSWVDFAHNRNEALFAAKGKADYLLLIDADEIWEYQQGFVMPQLDKDYYHVVVRQLGAADVKRIGLINNHLDWKWKGILHEVLECPQAHHFGLLKGVRNICNSSVSELSITPEKYVKRAQLLEEALKKEPTNSRYAFYMAQSYLNGNQYEEAIKGFERRLGMESSDIQETYLAMYNKGTAHDKLSDYEAALRSYFKAYEMRPIRAEPLFRSAIIYRKQGNYLLGYLLSKYALAIPYPAEDLCVEYMTYDHQLLIEFANCTLLSGRFQEGLQACQKLLANPNLPADIKPRVIANAEMATKNLYGVEQKPSL